MEKKYIFFKKKNDSKKKYKNKYSFLSCKNNTVPQRLLLAVIITTIFMIIEGIGGLISGSLALLADAGHMFIDTATLFMSFLATRLARCKPNYHYTFGYIRITTLVAFFNAFSLFFITSIIIWEAINRFFVPQLVSSLTMMFTAFTGLILNFLLFRLLHNKDKKEKNINLRIASLHVLGDFFGSIGAIIAALIIFYTNWFFIDPILSILVSFLVSYSCWKLFSESLYELMESTANKFDLLKIKNNLINISSSIKDIHHIHIWQVGECLIMTLHLQVTTPYDHDMLLNCINNYLFNKYYIEHTTIQIEFKCCKNINCMIYKSH